MTDQELLRAYAQSSDASSLGVFVSRYQDSLLRFAAKLLGDPEAAQDVVQEAFLQVARHPRRLLGIHSCHNWLLKVTRNIGIDHLRRKARARRHAEAIGAQAAEARAAGGVAAGGALEREEVRTRVRAALDGLSPRHRELILLKVQEEKSYKEIAGITGLTVTNVGYLLHTAMKELGRKLNHSREDLL